MSEENTPRASLLHPSSAATSQDDPDLTPRAVRFDFFSEGPSARTSIGTAYSVDLNSFPAPPTGTPSTAGTAPSAPTEGTEGNPSGKQRNGSMSSSVRHWAPPPAVLQRRPSETESNPDSLAFEKFGIRHPVRDSTVEYAEAAYSMTREQVKKRREQLGRGTLDATQEDEDEWGDNFGEWGEEMLGDSVGSLDRGTSSEAGSEEGKPGSATNFSLPRLPGAESAKRKNPPRRPRRPDEGVPF
ncbi:hypothetical protein IAT38_003238 [Cryptococcus sp. DSM 104549]